MNSFFVVFLHALQVPEVGDFLVEDFEECPFDFIGESLVGEDEIGVACSSHFLQEEISFGEDLIGETNFILK